MTISDRINQIYSDIATQKWRFLGVFFAVVLVSYFVLYLIDFIPEPVTKEAKTTTSEETVEVLDVEEEPTGLTVVTKDNDSTKPVTEPVVESIAALPTKIIVDKLNKEIEVSNPTSNAVTDLDTALLEGAVRHPDSADFVNTGNIFILGHSSYLPNVMNKNFQAFNGIQKLTWGDVIHVRSADREYIYRVEKVFEAKASEVVVPLDENKPKLTLSTCNSFGSKDDRFIVEATLIDTQNL